MKIRQGFVSNSSSSSFIICIAKISDIGKVKMWLDGLERKHFGEKVFIDFFHSGSYGKYGVRETKDGGVELESFMDSVKISGMKHNDMYATFEYAGGSDSDFEVYCGGEFSHYDYDIDRDFFSKEINEIVDGMMNPENGFYDAQMSFGAGRDG